MGIKKLETVLVNGSEVIWGDRARAHLRGAIEKGHALLRSPRLRYVDVSKWRKPSGVLPISAS